MIIPSNYSGIYFSTRSEEPRQANAFKEEANSTLDEINSGPTGHQLLSNIARLASKGERKLTVREVDINEQTVHIQAVLTRPQLEKYFDGNPSFSENTRKATQLSEEKFMGKGKGTSAIIHWHPRNNSVALNGNGSPVGLSDGGSRDRITSLSHELVHAKHIMDGTRKAGYDSRDRYDTGTSAGKEEMRAVGVGKYAYSKTGEPSENSIRQEHNLPLRKRYGPISEY